ncbi:MAG: heavy-metal-associated domain-containing protein [Paludibacter sp.]|nr:heavy-metal-associated domain-containing protein [Paludibacter sp.]
MKTKIILIALLSFLFVGGMFAKKEKVTFSVEMDCMSCKQKIEKNIAFEKGVKDMDVNFEKKTVILTYDDSKTDIAKLQKGFKKIGYEAVVVKPAACCGENTSEGCKEKCADKKSEEACKTKECETKVK